MALKINFDSSFNPEKPTLILATKNGNKIGQLDAKNIVVRDNMNEPSEIKFCVYKFIDGKECQIWNDITNFKLVWCAEWDVWFELTVDIINLSSTHSQCCFDTYTRILCKYTQEFPEFHHWCCKF